MATDGPVSRFNSVAYSAGDERLLDSALLMPGPASAPFSARSGRRVNGSGLQVSVAGSPEAWTVTPGPGVVYDTANASAGGWRFALRSAKSANLPARPGVGQSRIDYVIARIYDTDVLGAGPREFKIEHVAGGPGSTPSPPDMSTRPLSFILATLNVPNTGPISITQSAARTAAAGGILPVATVAERDALKTDGTAYEGMYVDVASTNSLDRYDGTNWISGNPGWETLILGNEWVPFGGPYATPAIKMDGTKISLRGLIKSGATGGIANLFNAAHRPLADEMFIVQSDVGSARVEVTAAGLVQLPSYNAGGGNGFVSLSGISWERA